jgi:hypothetical protein
MRGYSPSSSPFHFEFRSNIFSLICPTSILLENYCYVINAMATWLNFANFGGSQHLNPPFSFKFWEILAASYALWTTMLLHNVIFLAQSGCRQCTSYAYVLIYLPTITIMSCVPYCDGHQKAMTMVNAQYMYSICIMPTAQQWHTEWHAKI